MKKQYETPQADVITISVEDIMVESNRYDLPEIPIGGLQSYKFD